MRKLFGTDGIRGESGVFPLDKNTIEIVGESLARQFKEKLNRIPRFIIGRDTRESGRWIEQAFYAGAREAGAHCESAEIITTPGVAYLTRKFDFDAGIIISASHNPFQDNGIKIFSPSGKKLDELTEREIEKDILDSAQNEPKDKRSGAIDTSNAAKYQDSYLKYLKGEFENLSLKNLKIVMDCANGASSNLAPTLFKSLDADVIVIHDQPDGRNINKDCGSLHLENLQAKVLETGADFGVAFDGDADRALFVDEKGNLIDGDATLWVMSNHLKKHGKLKNNTVVATVMSNLGLEIALGSKNIKLLRTAVGDKYVLQELLKTDSDIGGEQSGHIILPHKSLVGDGLMTTLYLLEAMRENEKSLSEITDGFRRFPQILVNIKVKEKRPFEDVAVIADAAGGIEKELGSKGRLLLRYSGTENLARVMIEGEDQEDIESKARNLAKIIEESLG